MDNQHGPSKKPANVVVLNVSMIQMSHVAQNVHDVRNAHKDDQSL
jgi:hypothetical protein